MILNALHAFFLKISRPIPIYGIAALAILLAVLINLHALPGIPKSASLQSVGLLDTTLNYSPATAYTKLAAYGEQGRDAYRLFLLRADFVFPAIYGLFFVMTTTYAFARIFPDRPALQKLSLITLGTSLFDCSENICFLAMLRSYPQQLTSVARVANVFTLTKWTFAVASILLLLMALAGLALQTLRPVRKILL